jgi:hypothetical protein
MTYSSWLVRPDLGSLQVEAGAFDTAEQIIKIGIAVLSLLLVALSLSAYRRTKLSRLLYAAGAFGLFAFQTIVEFLEDATGFGRPYGAIISPTITLAILVLLFLAIVRRERV